MISKLRSNVPQPFLQHQTSLSIVPCLNLSGKNDDDFTFQQHQQQLVNSSTTNLGLTGQTNKIRNDVDFIGTIEDGFSTITIEIDANSLDDFRIEAPEKPPGMEQLQESTAHRFSEKWIKYMYAKFKNECPSGRMKFAEFKRLFGVYIPDRLNDAYLERFFRAFCYASPHLQQITFKDLLICLSRLCDNDPRANAEWTMRLISNDTSGVEQKIYFQEFHDFVKSIFMLVGRHEQGRKPRSGSLLLGGGPDCGRRTPTVKSVAILASAITTPCAAPSLALSGTISTSRLIFCRASTVFEELDQDGKGYLVVEDLEKLFREKINDNFI